MHNQSINQSIRSEPQIYVNSGMTCNEFYSYVLSDSKLLNAATMGRNIAGVRSFESTQRLPPAERLIE